MHVTEYRKRRPTPRTWRVPSENTERNKTWSIHLPTPVCRGKREWREGVPAADCKGNGWKEEWGICSAVTRWLAVSEIAAVGPNYQTVTAKQARNFWELETSCACVCGKEKSGESMKRRDPLFTLSSLYKNKTDSLEGKMQLFIADSSKIEQSRWPEQRGSVCRGLCSTCGLHPERKNTVTKHFFLSECKVRQFPIRRFTGWWRYDSIHDYLWLFEREPTGESGLSLQIKKKQWGVVLSEARVLVADKPTRCGALRSFFSAASLPYTHIHTNTSAHLMSLLISEEREPPLQVHNRSAFPLSLSPHSHLFGRWNQSSSHRWHAVALETYKKRRCE